MKTKLIALTLFGLLLSADAFSQETIDPGRKHFISTSVWMLANLGPEAPDFYELNYGIRLNERDTIIFNATT